MLRARRVLDSLAVGGGTPLSAALVRSLEVAKRAARQKLSDVKLLVFTDGRANVPLHRNLESKPERQLTIQRELESLGWELSQAGVSVTVVAIQDDLLTAEPAGLAERLKAQLVRITSR
jgi:Mg-chelatase subunit ChlD